jgi:hypothetical protein
LTAVKHGNGRDWWVIFRKWNNSPSAPNNEFHRYLVTPAGVSNYTVQNIGAIQSSGFGNIVFNSDGSRFAYANYKGLLEIYDFDRCTGVINNPQNLYQENSQWPWRKFWGLSFSPNDSLLYLTVIPEQSNDTSRLLQFNLYAPNIAASADTLVESDYVETFDQLNKAPDGKIYLATGYNQYYPFADSMYNSINMNLSVINSPDSIGSACDLQLYSFYLGGKRVYAGLPNNPDYHLGPKIGSGCDTLTTINEHSQQVVISNLFPNPNNGSFTVNYFLPNGKPGVLTVFNFEGRKVFELPLPRYTYMQNIELKNLPAGMYALRIQSGNKSVIKKFVKE